MKRLGLLRHAKSDWSDLHRRDFDRGLNQRGRRGAAAMGKHIGGQGASWDAIVASPAKRVKLTLEASGLALPVSFANEAYLADGETLLGMVRALPDQSDAIILAGHNPGLQDFALMLAAPQDGGTMRALVADKFPTAAFAVLELDIGDWRACAPGCGRLVHFARPRDLDPELGPQPAQI